MTRQNLTFQMQKKARNPLPGGKKRGKKEDTSMARELKFWKHLTDTHQIIGDIATCDNHRNGNYYQHKADTFAHGEGFSKNCNTENHGRYRL